MGLWEYQVDALTYFTQVLACLKPSYNIHDIQSTGLAKHYCWWCAGSSQSKGKSDEKGNASPVLQRILEMGKEHDFFDPNHSSFSQAGACLKRIQLILPEIRAFCYDCRRRDRMLSEAQLTGDVRELNEQQQAEHKLAIARADCVLSKSRESRLASWQKTQLVIVTGSSAASGVSGVSGLKPAEQISPHLYVVYLTPSKDLRIGIVLTTFRGTRGRKKTVNKPSPGDLTLAQCTLARILQFKQCSMHHWACCCLSPVAPSLSIAALE